ncbi:autophagy protein 1 [Heterostelium album PN500]|uniref:Autophagy protein 1 n=1 Tax=Heterostelium pallidum (strain ATCC 26659 / Pp 5 / PN500) TaxID=670386 RepID=D3AXA3_HETP5|nr:autophagy protein 1 [Heterostelium album PN500]EFA86172.1 autophagy protein 1 [Heterostelium album PN500]|eukprot:XP_020438277.1 autophagy protein 1 [Heterostelium album PN500]
MIEKGEIENYILQSRLGSGAFAQVFRAVHRTSGNVVAIKMIDVYRLTERNSKLKENLNYEIKILKSVSHPNIVTLYDVLEPPPPSDSYIYMIMECCEGGDFSSFIRKHKRLTEEKALYFMRQLANGLRFLRMNDIIHRDLKPQNLLLSDNSDLPTLKIADFGFARFIDVQSLSDTFCGSPLYMAPEILYRKNYTVKADLWSQQQQQQQQQQQIFQQQTYQQQQQQQYTTNNNNNSSSNISSGSGNNKSNSDRILLNNQYVYNQQQQQQQQVVSTKNNNTTSSSSIDFEKDCVILDDEEAINGVERLGKRAVAIAELGDLRQFEPSECIPLYLKALMLIKSKLQQSAQNFSFGSPHLARYNQLMEKLRDTFKEYLNKTVRLYTNNLEMNASFSPNKLIYESALEMGRNGGVEEMYSDYNKALQYYSDGILLLEYLYSIAIDREDQDILNRYIKSFSERIITVNRKCLNK